MIVEGPWAIHILNDPPGRPVLENIVGIGVRRVVLVDVSGGVDGSRTFVAAGRCAYL